LELPLTEVMAQLRVVNKAIPSVTHSCDSQIFNTQTTSGLGNKYPLCC